ncbi:MAG: lysyl oxidase family protein [Chitinophagales bacterium]
MHKYILLLLSLFSSFWISAQSCPAGYASVEIKIVPDQFTTETTWSLRNAQTGALLDTGNYIGDTICVPNSACLVFTIFDAYGDGICCSYGNGSYQVKYNGSVVGYGGSFLHYERTYFNCPPGTDCNSPLYAVKGTQTAPFRDSWYYFVTDSAGTWRFSTCSLGNSCDTRLYIYDRCHGVSINDDVMGTMYYNDNEPSCVGDTLRSVITAALPAHDTIYIRIGDAGTSCTGAINWNLSYLGPIRGCTDPLSCNYNPSATISDTSCIYPPNPICHAPDLMVVGADINNTIYLDSLNYATGCYVPEGCLQGYGMRYILRFDTHIKNVGDQDYFIGVPNAGNPQFTWDPCHGHWHYVGYAEYVVFNALNQQQQVGYKNGFCVLDLECSGGGTAKFGCSNMGITAGCGDIYNSGLSCQWVDITNLDTGKYTLVVRVNWDRSPDMLGHYEKGYSNNWAQLCFHLGRDAQGKRVFTKLTNCPMFVDCSGDTLGSKQLDCNGTCGGTAIRGDIDINAISDTADISAYLQGLVNESIPYTICNDLNGDSSITVTDAHRLNECQRYQAGTLLHISPSHPHCDFPRNIANIYDTVTLSIGNTNFASRYFDVTILNPRFKMLAYEFKIKGAVINHVTNLVPAFATDTRSAANGHIAGLARTEAALVKNIAPIAFLRVYYDTLTDSNICISKIYSLVNENYEESTKKIGNSCFAHPFDSVNVVDTFRIHVSRTNSANTYYHHTTHYVVSYQGTTNSQSNDTVVVVNTSYHSDTIVTPGFWQLHDWTYYNHNNQVNRDTSVINNPVVVTDTIAHYDTIYAYAHDTVFCHTSVTLDDTLLVHVHLYYTHQNNQVTVTQHNDSVHHQQLAQHINNSYRIDLSLPVHPLVIRDTLPICDTSQFLNLYTIADTVSVHDTLNIGINEIGAGTGIRIIPNPNNGKFELWLDGHTEVSEYKLYNPMGQLIQQQQYASHPAKIALEVGNESDGVYLLKITTSDGIISLPVLVKK